jgi:ABC-type nitrate/sulfonate/bicarbonate transport system substrate-binding protein
MMLTRRSLLCGGAALAGGALVRGTAGAAETVSVGTVGQASANLWPVFIGIEKGLFAAEDLAVDIVYVQSSAQLVQQITAGSLNICMSTGLVDPLRAIAMGAPIALLRVEVQAPPYALIAKPAIKRLEDLKGKVISLGGPKDITRIYVERMLIPHGVKPGEFDMVFAGATAARASALLAGAVDAAILLPPFNFQAISAGFTDLGLTIDYVKDLPFSGTVVNAAWAKAHEPILRKMLTAHSKSVAWFEDEANRAEAVRILMKASGLKQDDVEKAYDFMRKGRFFEPTGKVSRGKLRALADAMASLGDLPGTIDIDRVTLPGITQLVD